MITNLKPYPAYKDSGVEWLGKVPEHWVVRRLKNAARVIMGQSPSSNDCSVERIGLPFLQGCAEFGVEYPQPKQFCKAPSKVSPAGAILMSVRAPVGRLNTADQEYGIGRGLCAIVPHPGLYHSRFIRFGVIVCLEGLAVLSTGSTYDAVSVADVAGLRIPLPPLPEQALIVHFLDWTERRLRKAISLRQKRIKLLEEYKQALINEAVTGKIDVRTGKPYPAYKDSGVEWLGKVPEHWEVRHLKRIVSEPITDGPHETPKLLDNGIDFISAEAMVNGRIDFEKRRGYISNEDHEYFCKKIKPQFNDIFMCKSGATTGKVVILDIDKEFSVWSPLALIRVNLIITYPSFTFKALQSSYIQDQVKTKWSAGTQPNLSMNDMKFLFISLPPLPEQAAIVEYLNKRCAKIDSAITSDRKVIELLKEFRTRLIADVVTGKLDVRDVAEKLPEEPEEEMEPIEGETEEKEASEIDALSEEETDE